MSAAQRAEALRNANAVRAAKAETRRRLRTGAITITQALRGPGLGKMLVVEVLQEQHGWGPDRVVRAKLGPLAYREVWRLTDRDIDLIGAAVIRTPGNVPVDPDRGRGKYQPVPPQERHYCVGCGGKLLEKVPDGTCGFCRLEADEVAA